MQVFKRGRVALIRRCGTWLTGLLAVFVLAALAIVIAGTREDVRPRDVAVILGSTVHENGVPSARLAARLDRGLALYRAGVVKHVIVSGGVGKEGHDEAQVMHDYLRSAGMPPEAILVDSDGRDTESTARNCARLMRGRFSGVIVVSQYFHNPRVRLALHAHGVTDTGSAYARFFEVRDLYSIAREVVALPVYWMRSGR